MEDKNSAVLLIDCPDRKGLVAAVASLLYRYGANITPRRSTSGPRSRPVLHARGMGAGRIRPGRRVPAEFEPLAAALRDAAGGSS